MSGEGLTFEEPYELTPADGPKSLDLELGQEMRIGLFLRQALLDFGYLSAYNDESRLGNICGPTHAVYARLLALATDIEFKSDSEGESLELCIGYYWPQDAQLASDHTYIKYNSGRGISGYIDLVYPMLWNNARPHYDRVQELVNYRLYPTDIFEQRLAEEFQLHSFGANTPDHVWRHPTVTFDLPDLSAVEHATRTINQPDISDITFGNWRQAALDLYDEWVGYMFDESARPLISSAWTDLGAAYSQPRREYLPYENWLGIPREHLPASIGSFTETVARRRFSDTHRAEPTQD